MYYSCHCIKRNGLQHDCRRTGCGGEPGCLVLPDPVCAPSQLARARGLADSAPFAAHMAAVKGGGGPVGAGGTSSGSGGGKKFIVCELKGILPETSAGNADNCCKCTSQSVPLSRPGGACPCPSGSKRVAEPAKVSNSKCPCKCSAPVNAQSDQNGMFVFDEESLKKIIASFDNKELASKNDDMVVGPGGRMRKATKSVAKEEPCTRPGCVHWQPPPPCVWDLPCKADCFEAHPGIQPGRNPLTRTGGGGRVESGGSKPAAAGSSYRSRDPRDLIKLLTAECCTGCSATGGGSGGAASGGGGPVAGLPMLVMKLC